MRAYAVAPVISTSPRNETPGSPILMTETIDVRHDDPDPVPDGPSTPVAKPHVGPVSSWVAAGAFAVVTVLCGFVGFYTTFNSFGPWDDEGYLLSALHAFAHHGGLYTHVYSAFGPFYFEAFSTIFSWLPVTLDNGRIVTIVVTLLASLGFGVAVKMFTQSVIAGAATQLGIFLLLILSFVDESMHPTLLVSLLFSLALIALALVARGQRAVGCVMLGATVAALVLTVVNVGAFAAIASLFTGLVLAAPTREMRLPRAAAALLFVGTPFLLIMVAGGHSTESWAIKYSVVVAMSAAGVVIVTMKRPLQGLVHGRDAYGFLIGGGVMGVVVVAIALLSGTQPLDLFRGLFIDPARFVGFTIPLSQPRWIEAWGVVGLAAAVVYRRYGNRNSPAGLIDSSVHVAVGLLILYFALQQAQQAFSVTFTEAMPLLFFAAIAPAGATDSERVARVGVVALAVLEGLVAYPVAGAQVRWSALLFVPAGMLCLHDGIHQLRLNLAVTRLRLLRAAALVVASLVVLASLGRLASVWYDDLSVESNGYFAGTPLNLPGSTMIHLPSALDGTLESFSHAVKSQCSSFLAVPAINSFYLWTGESLPPDWFNVWFYTGDAALQKQIVHHIEAQHDPRFCVVDSPTWSAFWAQHHVLPQLPLARFVERFRREHSPPQVINDYRLFVSHSAAP